MIYPSYGRVGKQRVSVSAFDGGIDAKSVDTALAENCLRDACNVWWKDGALCTRPGLQMDTCIDRYDEVRIFVAPKHTVYYREYRGQLIFMARERSDGMYIDVVLCRENGMLMALRPLLFADFEEPIEQLIPVFDGKGICLLYINAKPYRLEENGDLVPVPVHVPTVVVAAEGVADLATAARLTSAAGTPFEPFNRLTDAFSVEYRLKEGCPYFTLPTLGRGRAGTLAVALKGIDAVSFSVHSDGGETVFAEETGGLRLSWSAPSGVFYFTNEDGSAIVPDLTRFGEMVVTFTPDNDQPSAIQNFRFMRFGCWYGGNRGGLSGGTRYFLAGDVDHPHILFYSAVEDPTYFPENGDLAVGEPNNPITALEKQGDMLVIFKERELWCVSYQQGITDQAVLSAALESGEVSDVESAVATFPLSQISPICGCDTPETIALCDNRLVWTNKNGAVHLLVSGSIYSERNVRMIGGNIVPLLKNGGNKPMAAVDWNDHYALLIGNELFLFNYNVGGISSVGSHTANAKLEDQTAWYRWEFPKAVATRGLISENGCLIVLGTWGDVGLFTCPLKEGTGDYLADSTVYEGEPVHSMISLPTYTFGAVDRQKTVHTLFLDLGCPNATVTVRPIGDRDDRETFDRRLTTDAHGFVECRPSLRRVRTFSLKLETDSPIVLRNMTLTTTVH